LAYTGVDLSEQAMQIGEQNVRPMLATGTQLLFVIDDMLNFVRQAATASYDLVFSSIAVHHLQDNEKEQLVHEVRRIIKPGGAFLLIDTFLQESEDRDHFIEDFIACARDYWVKLNVEQIDSLVNHIFNFDFPAKLTAYQRWAKETSLYTDVKCLENLRFYKTIVLEI
jgi:SAM-dependent methyltransferase